MRSLFQKFRKDESGATLVEYGVALILETGVPMDETVLEAVS